MIYHTVLNEPLLFLCALSHIVTLSALRTQTQFV